MVLLAAALPPTSRLGSPRVTKSARPKKTHHAVCGVAKKVCSPELIEHLSALQEKSPYVLFTALGAGLQENKNP